MGDGLVERVASVGTPSWSWKSEYVFRSTSSFGVAVSPISRESNQAKIWRYFWYTERCASSMITRSKYAGPNRRVPSSASVRLMRLRMVG